MTTTAQPQAAGISPGGLLALALIAYAVAALSGWAPTPLELVRRARGARTSPGNAGQERRSEGLDMTTTPDTSVSGQDMSEPSLIPALPPEPGDHPNFVRVRSSRIPWGPQPLDQVLAAAGMEARPDGPEAPTQKPAAQVRLRVVGKRVSQQERLRWLADRERPGDRIAAQCSSASELEAAAALALGVDRRTIRRDRAKLYSARARRTN